MALQHPVSMDCWPQADGFLHRVLFVAAPRGSLVCVQAMAGLLATAEARGGRIGALTFGVELPSGEHAFPSSPTWLLHAGGVPSKRCYDGAPVILRGSTFCDRVPGARAGVIKSYSVWALARLLSHAGLHLHTYPQVLIQELFIYELIVSAHRHSYNFGERPCSIVSATRCCRAAGEQ